MSSPESENKQYRWWKIILKPIRILYWRILKYNQDRPHLSRHFFKPIHVINEIRLLRRIIKEYYVDCVFDVGANTGQYAKMLRKDVGFKGIIISFEPNPEAFIELKRKATTDPLWIVENIALSDRDGELTFNVMHGDQFSSLHNPSDEKTKLFSRSNIIARTVPVVARTLKSILPHLQATYKFTRPFLKMDTQGHDAAVVRGCGEQLSVFIGLQSELSIIKIYEGTLDYIETIKFYESLGYNLSAFLANNRGHFPTLIETDCLMLRRDLLKAS